MYKKYVGATCKQIPGGVRTKGEYPLQLHAAQQFSLTSWEPFHVEHTTLVLGSHIIFNKPKRPKLVFSIYNITE